MKTKIEMRLTKGKKELYFIKEVKGIASKEELKKIKYGWANSYKAIDYEMTYFQVTYKED